MHGDDGTTGRAGWLSRAGGGTRLLLMMSVMGMLWLAAPAAKAQHVELTGLGGLQFGGSTDLVGGSGSFDPGPAWGVIANWRVREDGLFGLTYSRQRTQFVANGTQNGVPFQRNVDVDVGILHAGGELEIKPEQKFTPLLGLSVGATHFTPRDGGDTNWFFSAALTGGGKYRITDHIGLRAQMRLIATVVGGNNTIACSSNGGLTCAISADVDGIIQGDLVAGIFVAF